MREEVENFEHFFIVCFIDDTLFIGSVTKQKGSEKDSGTMQVDGTQRKQSIIEKQVILSCED